ncbi:hypothetical protein SAMD00019534_000190 [Acytostelium subglobosum LB1]|uniref:hypothetical protein n=1 Tax=Acytostelium subglobosum LB1 TaxID=1410327 RepID=UPI000644A48B|nr:hypothetical protein SAMD00019534_000190 [Acytostelium subglobosum LB1]GAM16844.1 hypothetical protein SAMD00019534_000190 [Acytostelium subglobosum LB1]|eukprot:XP_012758906.1 hypothetical protein SAMD00019534_000190 [Acytostelium subglobosum LB1]
MHECMQQLLQPQQQQLQHVDSIRSYLNDLVVGVVQSQQQQQQNTNTKDIKNGLNSIIQRYIDSNDQTTSFLAWKLAIPFISTYCRERLEVIQFMSMLIDKTLSLSESFTQRLKAQLVGRAAKVVASATDNDIAELDEEILLTLEVQEVFVDLYTNMFNHITRLEPLSAQQIRPLFSIVFTMLKQSKQYKEVTKQLADQKVVIDLGNQQRHLDKQCDAILKKIESLYVLIREQSTVEGFFSPSSPLSSLTQYCLDLFSVFEVGIDTSFPTLLNTYKSIQAFISSNPKISNHVEYRNTFEKTATAAYHNLVEMINITKKNGTEQTSPKYLKLFKFYSNGVQIFYRLFSNKFLSLDFYANHIIDSYTYLGTHIPSGSLISNQIQEIMEEHISLLLQLQGESIFNNLFQLQHYSNKSANTQNIQQQQPDQLKSRTIGKLKAIQSLFNRLPMANITISIDSLLSLLMLSMDLLPHCPGIPSLFDDTIRSCSKLIANNPSMIGNSLIVSLAKNVISTSKVIQRAASHLWEFTIRFGSNTPLYNLSYTYILHLAQLYSNKDLNNHDDFYGCFSMLLRCFLNDHTKQIDIYKVLVQDALMPKQTPLYEFPSLPILFFKSLVHTSNTSQTILNSIDDVCYTSIQSLKTSLDTNDLETMINTLYLFESIHADLISLHAKSQLIDVYIQTLNNISSTSKSSVSSNPNIVELILLKLASLSSALLPKQIPNLLNSVSTIDDISPLVCAISQLLHSLLSLNVVDQMDQMSFQTTIRTINKIITHLISSIGDSWPLRYQVQSLITDYSKKVKSKPTLPNDLCRAFDNQLHSVIEPIGSIEFTFEEEDNKQIDMLTKLDSNTLMQLARQQSQQQQHIGQNGHHVGGGNNNSNNNNNNNTNTNNGNVKTQFDLVYPTTTAAAGPNRSRNIAETLRQMKDCGKQFFNLMEENSNNMDRLQRTRYVNDLKELLHGMMAHCDQV